MKRYPHVRIDIYENNLYPVVSHVFFGKTLKEAKGYVAAHVRTDEFLRSALKKGYWKDLKLHVEIYEDPGE